MEPRELWERHEVMARAFCSSDDEVRRVQSALDEAQAGRARTLAAFAVTVGSDGAVAGLLGLNEREVRVARRTVGKDDAHRVAEALWERSRLDRQPAPQDGTPEPESAAYASEAPAQPGPTPHIAGQVGEPESSPAVDAVLTGAWHTGADLTTLAAELGLDPDFLAARAQQLAAEGRLTPTPAPDHTGRHRRMVEGPPPPADETTYLHWHQPAPQSPHHQHVSWEQPPPVTWGTPVTTPQHAWDGYLSHGQYSGTTS